MNKVAYLMQDIIKNQKVIPYLKEFKRTLSFTSDEIKKYQFIKFKKLLVHASENVEFYKERFKYCGFEPRKLDSFDQIKGIPVLTRNDIQKNRQKIIAKGYNSERLYSGTSSGSTGQPVSYFKDNVAESAGQAAHLTGWSLSGWEMNLKGLHIWGNPNTVKNEWNRLSSKIKAGIFRHHKFPAYQLTDGFQFYKLYEKIRKNGYNYLDGYTNAIYLLAVFMDENDLPSVGKINYVFTTAENLHDFQRKIIEKRLGHVYDSYGCGEINGIAYECSGCGLHHIIDAHVYVEYGNIKDNTGSCELIITDLDNFAFPLIRYKNDDLGIPADEKQIGCQYKFSRLKSISGRESDIIRFKNGGALSVPSFFGSMLLKKVKGIKQYQVEVITSDLMNINIVRSNDFSDVDQKVLNDALEAYLQDKIKFQINFVQRIEASSSGKIKLVVDKTEIGKEY